MNILIKINMLCRTLISLILAIFICCSGCAYIFNVFNSSNGSAQYKNYKWGISKKEALQRIRDNGHRVTNLNLDEKVKGPLFYPDKIFGEDIDVSLVFTPETEKLCAVIMFSRKDVVGRKLKPILTDKYGLPDQRDGNIDKFIWIKDGNPYLILKYAGGTTVSFYSEKYWSLWESDRENPDNDGQNSVEE